MFQKPARDTSAQLPHYRTEPNRILIEGTHDPSFYIAARQRASVLSIRVAQQTGTTLLD
jgi:hypothetical protein